LPDVKQPIPRRSAPGTAALVLLVIFLISLPLVNPWVRGDGVGYYAYVRALLIDHNLNFEKDWQAANSSFTLGRLDASGHLLADQYTLTGHVENHFSIGPAILWAPFLAVVHGSVLVADRWGAKIPADGFSRPYRVTMAVATAFYGFLALLLGFDVARRYVDQRWAALATFGIWFASSLPVYMYFNPSWSHAPSAFTVALFLWHWDRTRGHRSWANWSVLGLLAGLMMNVYYPTAVLLLLPLFESLARYWGARGGKASAQIGRLLGQNALFVAAALAALLPTLITKKIIYGSYFNFGYTERWFWNSPAFFRVCFSAEHGLFTWTPILIPAVVGLFLVCRYDPLLGLGSLCVFASYLYLIGCYQDWAGISSFGNRFFVSLTPFFVLGLAATLQQVARSFHDQRGVWGKTCAVVGLFVVWNLAFVFQWGTHLIPARGPISWRKMAYNQVVVVPVSSTSTLRDFVFRRQALMQHIEETDQQGQSQTGRAPE
jgi:Dolichyl-phosphate-mannose-protein mannosyltransferase